MLVLGGKVYEVCGKCGQIVRFDKPLLGSLHICVTPEEERSYRNQIAREAATARQTLEQAKRQKENGRLKPP